MAQTCQFEFGKDNEVRRLRWSPGLRFRVQEFRVTGLRVTQLLGSLDHVVYAFYFQPHGVKSLPV